MTDRHDIQRARRYIVEFGISREQFRQNFNAQFVRNNEKTLEDSGAFSRTFRVGQPLRFVAPIQVEVPVQKPKEVQKIKRIVIRHRYWRYNLITHRIAGKWHGSRHRKSGV